jgi:DNA-binding beta-propeller fold protein YncE
VALAPCAAHGASGLVGAGTLVQKRGHAGCVTLSGSAGACSRGRALGAARSIAISADGKSVYVASPVDGLAVFDRDRGRGALTQKAGRAGCVNDGAIHADRCMIAPATDALYAVAVSPDGASVYAGGLYGLSILNRFAGGALAARPPGEDCVADPASPEPCTPSTTVDFPTAVAVASDGRNVYVGSPDADAITIFDRDATGMLHQKAGPEGCLSAKPTHGACRSAPWTGIATLAVSPDARNVYVASRTGISVLARDLVSGTLRPTGCISESGSGGRCANGKAMKSVVSMAISPDGRALYATSVDGHTIAVFDRDAATGALKQKRGRAGCVSQTGTHGLCANAKALTAPAAVTTSPDGRSVYVGTLNGIAVFDRDLATGRLRQKRRRAGCVTETGSGGLCENGTAIRFIDDIAVSPDGDNVYAVASRSTGRETGTRDSGVAIFDRR